MPAKIPLRMLVHAGEFHLLYASLYTGLHFGRGPKTQHTSVSRQLRG